MGVVKLNVSAVVLLVLAADAVLATASNNCGRLDGDDDAIRAVRAAADVECDCNAAQSHRAYVHCVQGVAGRAVKLGVLRKQCKDFVRNCAERSTCGRKDAVACCRTNRKGRKKCTIERAAACKTGDGATACLGAGSCCDASLGGLDQVTTTTTQSTTPSSMVVTTSSTSSSSTTPTTSQTTSTTISPDESIVLPVPDPNPCNGVSIPCSSALIGSVVLISTQTAAALTTVASDEGGERFSLEWVPATDEENTGLASSNLVATDVFITFPGVPRFRYQRLQSGPASLDEANLMAGMFVSGNVRSDDYFNEAGCDWLHDLPAFLGGKDVDCSRVGGCCDKHDVCINRSCLGPDDDGNAARCAAREALLAGCISRCPACPLCLVCAELCRSVIPQCSADCNGCHHEVFGCFAACIHPDFCPGPSGCCAASICRKPQQCFDKGTNMPIYDSCDCVRDGCTCEAPHDPCDGEPNGRGDSSGDPHLVTFDRLAYDFQAVGEFVLVRSLDDGLEVQSRTRPWGDTKLVSVNSAVAMRVVSDRVGFYADRDPGLSVNGVAKALESGDLALPTGGAVRAADGQYLVTWPDGSAVRIRPQGAYLDLEVYLPAARRGRVAGLLGGFDVNPDNDLVTRNGMALTMDPTRDDLYDVYGESWRITQAESLFDYVGDETTETFTDRAFPAAFVDADSLSLETRQRAREVCRALGVTDPVLLDACIVDVALTGEERFALAPARIRPPARSVSTSEAGTFVYTNDFDGDVGFEWSSDATDVTPIGGRRFLGQFANETVSLTLTDLPLHAAVTVSFDLFVIQSWDGNGNCCCGPDVWDLSVQGGPALLHTTFASSGHSCQPARQAYPDAYPDGDHSAETGAAETGTLGYFYGNQADAVYRLSLTFPHSADSLVLDFSDGGLQGIGDESWGLDNLTVSLTAEAES